MNETLAKFWLFATHWTEPDVFETEEELNDEIELLHRQNLPTKVRERTNKEGKEELCSTSNRPTAITPATARAGGLGCETEERNAAKKSTQTRALFCI